MPYFCGKGYPCCALSLRGHGGSEGFLNWASLADYIEDLASATAEVEGPPIVIGHSMGGLVTQHYVADHAVKAAVLMATVPPSGLGSSAMHMSLFAPDVLWQLGLLQSLGPTAVSPEVIQRAFFSNSTSAAAVQHLMPRMQSESHRINAELLAPSQPRPPKNKPPMLVMGGDADVFLPTAAFRETSTYFQADLQILHGAPHGLMVDEAWWQPSADAILDWLQSKGL
jgi:pimeloyl-ACP methyl ester carboxylesterase